MAIFNNPHPLLDNNSGNFKAYSFNVELTDCSVDSGVYKFHLSADIDEDYILQLINEKKVSFVIQIENKPFYIQTFRAQESQLEVKIEIKYENISSDFIFDITPLLITNCPLSYQNVNADYPMGEYIFNLTANQIVGSHSPLKISFEKGYRKITSGPLIKLVRLKPPLKPRTGAMEIKLEDDDCIQVCVSDTDFTKLIALNRKEPKLLDAIITLPVLQFALSELRESEDLKEKNWARKLDEEYHLFHEMKDQGSVLKKCDEILNGSITSFVDYFDKKYLEK